MILRVKGLSVSIHVGHGEEDLEQRNSVQTDHFEKCEFSLCSLNKERRVVVEKLAGYQKSE